MLAKLSQSNAVIRKRKSGDSNEEHVKKAAKKIHTANTSSEDDCDGQNDRKNSANSQHDTDMSSKDQITTSQDDDNRNRCTTSFKEQQEARTNLNSNRAIQSTSKTERKVTKTSQKSVNKAPKTKRNSVPVQTVDSARILTDLCEEARRQFKAKCTKEFIEKD